MRAIAATALFLAVDGARVSRHQAAATCGVKGSVASNQTGAYIVNGDDAPACAWDWQVGLTRGVDSMPFCGAMLVDSDWVLTAAHCVWRNKEFKVVAGDHKPRERSSRKQYRDVTGPQIFVHPKYSGSTSGGYDLALIKLNSPMDLNGCVGTVCLPRDGDVEPGSSCWITGWGTLQSGGYQPDVLQEAEVQTMSNFDCWFKTGYSYFSIKDSMICAQGKTQDGGIVDACQGDSGGPLVCESGGKWTLYGATSWGRGCAGENYPGVWARVHAEMSWIDETMSA